MAAAKADRAFFLQPSRTVARLLLGMTLVCMMNGKRRAGMIVETECYPGPQDQASHAYRGKWTKRNQAEFLIGGHLYIYLVYGMYWQCNISTEQEGKPSCVLIRAIDPTEGYEEGLSVRKRIALANGPGKLCRWLKLSGEHYGKDITKSGTILIETLRRPQDIRVMRTPRINIDYAGSKWATAPLRYLIKDYQPFLAKPTSKWY